MSVFARSDDVRKRNRSRILSAIRRNALISRTEIARETGLSAATISAIVSNLLDEGIVSSPANGRRISQSRGRPQVSISMDPNAALVGIVTLELNILVARIFDYSGETLAEHVVEFEIEAAERRELRAQLIDCVALALAKTGRDRQTLRGITAGIQGTVDIAGQELLWSPISPHRDLPIGDWLREEFGIPIRVANDCDMIAHAVRWRAPHQFDENFAAILLSFGVGMGLFQRGQLINGTLSSGMEFGHMSFLPDGALCRCGKKGCIEAYAGDYAMQRTAYGKPGDEPPLGFFGAKAITGIVDSAEAGEAAARSAIDLAGMAIGTGLASVFALVDPMPVALVGAGTAAFDMMEPSIRHSLDESIKIGERKEIPIVCFPNESELLQQGCAISALTALDEEIANGAPR